MIAVLPQPVNHRREQADREIEQDGEQHRPDSGLRFCISQRSIQKTGRVSTRLTSAMENLAPSRRRTDRSETGPRRRSASAQYRDNARRPAKKPGHRKQPPQISRLFNPSTVSSNRAPPQITTAAGGHGMARRAADRPCTASERRNYGVSGLMRAPPFPRCASVSPDGRHSQACRRVFARAAARRLGAARPTPAQRSVRRAAADHHGQSQRNQPGKP